MFPMSLEKVQNIISSQWQGVLRGSGSELEGSPEGFLQKDTVFLRKPFAVY